MFEFLVRNVEAKNHTSCQHQARPTVLPFWTFFFFIEAYVDEFCINLMQVRVIEEEGTSTEAMPLYNLPAFLDFDRLVILAITFLRGSHDATGAKILHQYPA